MSLGIRDRTGSNCSSRTRTRAICFVPIVGIKSLRVSPPRATIQLTESARANSANRCDAKGPQRMRLNKFSAKNNQRRKRHAKTQHEGKQPAVISLEVLAFLIRFCRGEKHPVLKPRPDHAKHRANERI